MWVLGWVVYPMVAAGKPAADAGVWRLGLLGLGLIWQFVLSLIILYWEEGNIHIGTIKRRFWLNNPVSPKTGEVNNRLWWMLLPFFLLVAFLDAIVSGPLNNLVIRVMPFMAAPPGFDFESLTTPELLPQWVGAWDLFALTLVVVTFNTFLGEEFIFRGVLLPKMEGVFGKWDWVTNAILFSVYHLHQPWTIPGNIVSALAIVYPGRAYRSNWFPIILHSGQSVMIIILVLGLVLGLV
jgi:membrane protease YdiL (CAAX protease family)